MPIEYPFIATTDLAAFDGYMLHAPFLVAIRSLTPSDTDLLSALGLSNYHRCPIEEHSFSRQVFITNVGEWTLVADDWYYTLWHTGTAARACTHWGDVFAFVVGDSDESYGFDLFEAGEHRRALQVDSPHYNDRVTIRDDGTPLPGERPELFEKDAILIVWTVAKGLGISPDPHTTRFRRYAPPREAQRRIRG